MRHVTGAVHVTKRSSRVYPTRCDVCFLYVGSRETAWDLGFGIYRCFLQVHVRTGELGWVLMALSCAQYVRPVAVTEVVR